ncbi:MAG: hypothetical protein HWN71_04005 [Desulfobacterales bacterium]|nr:hypothetical protein [Desulfobacterales bacterium]
MEMSWRELIDELVVLKSEHVPVHFSRGYDPQAEILRKVADNAYGYLGGFFQDRPELVLLVLSETDWMRCCPNQPYGNPFVPDIAVRYGVKPPESWKEHLVSLSTGAPQEFKENLIDVSGSESGTVADAVNMIFTFEFFAPTLAHEFMHPFLSSNLVLPQPIGFRLGTKLDSFWLAEFLPQYAMYSFLKRTDEGLCEKWQTLWTAAYEGGNENVRYTALFEMGRKYPEMRESCVENIFWYQAKLFAMSADLYELHGEEFLIKAIDGLTLRDRLLFDRLDQAVGGFDCWLRNWK